MFAGEMKTFLESMQSSENSTTVDFGGQPNITTTTTCVQNKTESLCSGSKVDLKNLNSDAYMVFGVFVLVLLVVFIYYFKQALVRLQKPSRAGENVSGNNKNIQKKTRTASCKSSSSWLL